MKKRLKVQADKPNKNSQNNSKINKNMYYKFNFRFLELYNDNDKEYESEAHKNLFSKIQSLSNDKITIVQGRGKSVAFEQLSLNVFTSTSTIKTKLKQIEDSESIYRNNINTKDENKVSVFRIKTSKNAPSRVICYEKSGIIFLLYLDISGEAYKHSN